MLEFWHSSSLRKVSVYPQMYSCPLLVHLSSVCSWLWLHTHNTNMTITTQGSRVRYIAYINSCRQRQNSSQSLTLEISGSTLSNAPLHVHLCVSFDVYDKREYEAQQYTIFKKYIGTKRVKLCDHQTWVVKNFQHFSKSNRVTVHIRTSKFRKSCTRILWHYA